MYSPASHAAWLMAWLPRMRKVLARPRSARANQCDKNTSIAGSTTASMTPKAKRSASRGSRW